MTIYSLTDFLTGFAEAVMLFMLYNTFCKKRECLPKWVYVAGIIALTLMVNISNTIFHIGILNIIGMIGSFFSMSFLYKGRVSVKAVISILTFALLSIIEIVVLFAVTIIFGVTVAEAVNIEQYRLLGIIISKTLALLVINIVRLQFKKKPFHMGTSYWILFFFMFAISTITVFLIFKLSYDIGKAYMYNLSIICSLGLLLCTFLALYLYERLAKQAELIQNQQQYEHHLKEQIKHLDEIVVTQNQIKKFKHDFLNYEIGLKSYLENKDLNGAMSYLANLSEGFCACGNDIETGNTALDAILSAKKAIAESKGIDFSAQIQIPQKLDVAAIDMCIIFGNAVDNAIEACERIKDGNKKIDLTLICQDKRIFCRIANTTAERQKGIFKTPKPDKQNHGFGLDNIKTTLAKYNSEPMITQINNEFVLKFIIFTK